MSEHLKVEIVDNKLVISIGVPLMCHAVKCSRYFESVPDGKEVVITDQALFSEAVVCELLHEEEDGTTLVHRMLDKAAENAIENGAEGVDYPY